MALNISHNGKQITKINGKEVHAICEPYDNGINWNVNHGFDLFADILTRPLIKVYGEEPASWSWAKQPANGTKYVDILRSMEWHVEGRNFITTDYVHQGGAGSQERFVVLEEKGVGGTYGLYSANPGALDRGYPRDNEIYFIQGSPHSGGSVIKKINSGFGTFPEFNVSGGGKFNKTWPIEYSTFYPYIALHCNHVGKYILWELHIEGAIFNRESLFAEHIVDDMAPPLTAGVQTLIASNKYKGTHKFHDNTAANISDVKSRIIVPGQGEVEFKFTFHGTGPVWIDKISVGVKGQPIGAEVTLNWAVPQWDTTYNDDSTAAGFTRLQAIWDWLKSAGAVIEEYDWQ